jgi:Tfp pilus assembly protein PilN
MNLFSIENITLEEISALRQSLNVIDIKGSSAQFIATLQSKLDKEIAEIQQMLKQEEKIKQDGISKIEKSIKSKP